jgi:ABC-2 type transport system ATP-binding protein
VTPGPVIEVAGLRKQYGGREVLSGVEFRVHGGEIVALLGPNGAGKTTTVEILEGYRRPDEGHVRVLGLDPARHGASLRPRLGVMLQEGGVDPRTTPREVLGLHARLYASPADPAALLELVGLERVAGTRYRRLSGGERQRLSLALALVGSPDLLILDEPTAGMDPAAKAATRDRILALRDAGRTILMTTHELSDVERLADRAVVLDRGRIVADGTPAELTGAGSARLRFRLPAALDEASMRSLVEALRDATRAPMDGADPPSLAVDGAAGAYRVDGPAAAPALVAALTTWCAARGLLLREVRTGSATLEERYLELVGGTGPEGSADGHNGQAPGTDAARPGGVDARTADAPGTHREGR